MDIFAYLENLLKTHKQVGLNGFGTFFKTKVPGRYDENTQSYIPPHYSLIFSKDTEPSDLLADIIRADKGFSQDTAQYHIEQFVKKLQQELDTNGTVALGNLGTLSGHAGHYQLTAGKNLSLGQDFFGYPAVKERETVVAPPLETFTEPGATDILPAETESSGPDAEAAAFEAPFIPEALEALPVEAPTKGFEAVYSEPEKADDPEEAQEEAFENTPKRGYIKWLIILFILLALGAVVLMYRPSIYEGWFENKPADTSFNKNALKNQADTLSGDTTLVNNIRSAINDSLATQSVAADSTSYEIYVTAVKSQKDAEKYIARYNKMGFKAKAFPGKLLINISVASFATESEARDSLPSVKKILNDNTIYIQKKKIK